MGGGSRVRDHGDCASSQEEMSPPGDLPNPSTAENSVPRSPATNSNNDRLELVGIAFLWLSLLLVIEILISPFLIHRFGFEVCDTQAWACAKAARVFGMDAIVQGNIVSTPDYYL